MTRFEGRPVDWATKPQPVEESRWRFPLVSEMPDEDLVSVGGDLQPSTVVNAYRRGVFPMEVTRLPGVLGWWSPDPRGILPLGRLRVTRSMRQSATRYEIRIDTWFARVIRGSAAAQWGYPSIRLGLSLRRDRAYTSRRAGQTLRVTPAMEAGLADHIGSIKEIVSLLERPL